MQQKTGVGSGVYYYYSIIIIMKQNSSFININFMDGRTAGLKLFFYASC